MLIFWHMWSTAVPAGMLKALLIDAHIVSSTSGAAFLRVAGMHILGGTIMLIAVLVVLLSSESDLNHQIRQLISHSRPHID